MNCEVTAGFVLWMNALMRRGPASILWGNTTASRKLAPYSPAFDAMSTACVSNCPVSDTTLVHVIAAVGTTGEVVTASGWQPNVASSSPQTKVDRRGVIV